MFKKIDWLTILWAIFILIICGIPGDRIPPFKGFGELVIDKFVHIIVFGILSYLWSHTQSRITLLILLCSIYGAIIEVLQAYVFINRSGDIRDWIADSVGVLIGALIFSKFKRNKAKRD